MQEYKIEKVHKNEIAAK